MLSVGLEKRGRESFVRSTLRAVPAKDSRPLCSSSSPTRNAPFFVPFVFFLPFVAFVVAFGRGAALPQARYTIDFQLGVRYDECLDNHRRARRGISWEVGGVDFVERGEVACFRQETRTLEHLVHARA